MSEERYGPAGGLGGEAFDNYMIPEGARIQAIHIFSGEYINGLQVAYIDAAGAQSTLPRLGSDTGTHHVLTFGADERITAVSGLCDWYIDTLTLHTTQRQTDAYGIPGTDRPFHLAAPAGHAVVGFFGRAGWYIDALGIITRSATTQPAAAPAAAGERKPQPKDLEKIEGIGPKIAGLLIAEGIYDLSDLAGASVERIKTILKAAGARYATADPSTWPEQAALGARGDWAGMEALQKSLKAGRR